MDRALTEDEIPAAHCATVQISAPTVGPHRWRKAALCLFPVIVFFPFKVCVLLNLSQVSVQVSPPQPTPRETKSLHTSQVEGPEGGLCWLTIIPGHLRRLQKWFVEAYTSGLCIWVTLFWPLRLPHRVATCSRAKRY